MSTIERVLQAYRVRDAWADARAIRAVVSAGGLAFALKLQRPFRRIRVEVAIREPRTRFIAGSWGGLVAVLDGSSPRIERPDGTVVARREDPRALFPGGRRLLWWDRLDQVYFSGYALWNYLTFPALLLREDVAWSELGPDVLEARFPPSIPTHNDVQRFHVDPETGLLRQHDYTAEVFGSWAKAANVVLAHGDANGVPYPSRRRVTPRAPDGSPRPFPVLVWIEIESWELV